MVRVKTRWLLVRIDYVDTTTYDSDVKNVSFPGKNELSRVIRNNLIQCSGVASSGAALDTQGRSMYAANSIGSVQYLCSFAEFLGLNRVVADIKYSLFTLYKSFYGYVQ